MKKILFGLALISLLPACKKDNAPADTISKENGSSNVIKVEKGRLNFTSVAAYENFLSARDKEGLINTLPEKEDFISYKNRKSNPQAAQARVIGNCDVPEDLIESNPVFFDFIINAEGIVEIADNLYRYDYCNEKVWVISVANAAVDTYYADFLAGIERRDVVGWFYTYVDAIAAVEEGYRTMPAPGTETDNEIFKGTLLGRTILEEMYINNDEKNPKGQVNARMDGKLSYDKFAVYFHFYGKEKYQERCFFNWCTNSGPGHRDWYVHYDYQYRRKGNSNPVHIIGNINPPLAGDNKVDKTFYEGSRGLRWCDATWDVEKVLTNYVAVDRNLGSRWGYVCPAQGFSSFAYRNNHQLSCGDIHFYIHYDE